MIVAERLDRSVAVVHELTARLRRDRGFGESSLLPVCELARQLAEDLGRRGRPAESCGLLLDSLRLVEGRRTRPGVDSRLEAEYALTWIELAGVRCGEGRYEEALACFQRARKSWKSWPGARVASM